jgi:hypothetical protein
MSDRVGFARVGALGLLAGAALVAATVTASATVVHDTYYGENDHGYGDIVGSASEFGIGDATVTRTGTDEITVVFDTTYNPDVFNGDTFYGSLFLVPGIGAWQPDGAAPFLSDSYFGSGTSTAWQSGYAVVMDDPTLGGDQTNQTASLFEVDESAGGVLNPSENPCTSGCTIRDGQLMSYTPDSSQSAVGSATWTADTTAQTLTFVITEGTPGVLSDNFAMHFTMSCANDVFEGQVDLPTGITGAPLPGALPLLVSGLMGFGAFGSWRRRRAAAS